MEKQERNLVLEKEALKVSDFSTTPTSSVAESNFIDKMKDQIEPIQDDRKRGRDLRSPELFVTTHSIQIKSKNKGTKVLIKNDLSRSSTLIATAGWVEGPIQKVMETIKFILQHKLINTDIAARKHAVIR